MGRCYKKYLKIWNGFLTGQRVKPGKIFDVYIKKKPKLFWTDNRNLNFDNAAGKVSKGSEKHIREGDLSDVVAESNHIIACSNMEVESVPNELSDLAKEISKRSVEGSAWFLLVAYSKM